jgi:hypothetical protein
MRLLCKNTFLNVYTDDYDDNQDFLEMPELFRSKTTPTSHTSSESYVTDSTRVSITDTLLSPVSDDKQQLNCTDLYTQLHQTYEHPADDDTSKTTCMLRNIPNKYDAESVIRLIDSKGYRNGYDLHL